jgi:hypothetical protein
VAVRLLREQSIVNDDLNGQPLLVSYEHDGGTGVIFKRMVDGRPLTFEERNGQLIDRETGTRWDRVTGTAIAGPLASKQLEQMPGTVSLNHAWASFYPESTYWQGPQRDAQP